MNKKYNFNTDKFYDFLTEGFSFDYGTKIAICDGLKYAVDELELDWNKFVGLAQALTNYDITEEEFLEFKEEVL